jgi:hypothetical protein
VDDKVSVRSTSLPWARNQSVTISSANICSTFAQDLVLQASACEVALENGASRVSQRQSRNNSSRLCCTSNFRSYAVDIEAVVGKVVCHVFRKLLTLTEKVPPHEFETKRRITCHGTRSTSSWRSSL